jgi:hypothetical protein
MLVRHAHGRKSAAYAIAPPQKFAMRPVSLPELPAATSAELQMVS